MRLIKLLILILVISVSLYSQDNPEGGEQIYRVPFLSSGNVIELSVQNISEQSLSDIRINVIDAPSWMNFKLKQKTIEAISSNGENAAEFSFSVDKTAVVNKEQRILFTISTPTGEVWTKEIKIVVTQPERFELYQNYPNPFNPLTIISYQLPISSNVTLKIFDLLGREVKTVLHEVKEAGYYEVEFVASELPSGVSSQGGYASGVYFYQMTAKDQSGKTTVARKKMILLR
jgi:hypothetical protein